MDNRIGSACWYKEKGNWYQGTILAWSTSHEEQKGGPAPFPVGVIEDKKSLKCLSILVDNITFASCPE